jgi:flavin reductase (DIM6/NTAB) family NADH-FMN oxidoreductase RutF
MYVHTLKKEHFMQMKKINNNSFIPMPMSIIGTCHEGKDNFMAAGWVTRANANPPMIAIGIGNNHLTNKTITANKTFSVNFPSGEFLIETDYVGIVSGAKKDKSEVFKTFYGDLKNVPLLSDAIIAMECKLVQAVKLETNTLFIGEIISSWSQEKFLNNSAVDYKKSGAFFLTMPDNQYWGFGENLGDAWRIGKKML